MKNSSMAILGVVMGLFVAVGHPASPGDNVIARHTTGSAQFAAREGGADRLADAGHRSVQLAAGEGGADRLGPSSNSAA